MVELTKSEEDMDWYDVLGLEIGASDGVINKAFKKLSLKYHPDKNAGSKKAEEMFMRVKEAKNFLLDSAKRKIYDEKRAARLQAEALLAERNRNMGHRRRHLREELERREKGAVDTGASGGPGGAASAVAAQRKAKIDDLQKRGEKLREERARAQSAAWEMARASIRQKRGARSAAAADDTDLEERTIKVKWSRSKESHSDDTLAKCFQRFGEVDSVSLREGKGNEALVTFAQVASAEAAVDALKDGDVLRASFVGKKKKRQKQEEGGVPARRPVPAQPPTPVESANLFRDRETLVMMRLRQEAERQALKRKIMEEEGLVGRGGGGMSIGGRVAQGVGGGARDTAGGVRAGAGGGAQGGAENALGNTYLGGPGVEERKRGGESGCLNKDGGDAGGLHRTSVRDVLERTKEGGGAGSGEPSEEDINEGGAGLGLPDLHTPAESRDTTSCSTRDVDGTMGDFHAREDNILLRMKGSLPPAEKPMSMAPVSVGAGAGGSLLNEGDILARMMLHGQ